MNKTIVAILSDGMPINGISKVIENYYTRIDRKKFDILLLSCAPINEYYKNLYNRKRINLIELPNRHYETLNYYYMLFKVLKKNKVDILHIHGNSMNVIVELFIGFLNGIKVRILHNHNTRCANPIRTFFLRPIFNLLCTNGLACGFDAGSWIFGKKHFDVINNGFEIKKFVYDDKYREIERLRLGIRNDSIVIGHVGRINDQKNQLFLLKIFESLATINENYYLIMVGDGPNNNVIREKVCNHKYSNRIIMLGEITCPEKIYSVFDLFVFPSKYEGLPIALLEAQISGLPCLVSDRITREVNLCDVTYISLEGDNADWTNKILEKNINYNRFDTLKKYKNSFMKYDINENVKKLEKLYDSFVYFKK